MRNFARGVGWVFVALGFALLVRTGITHILYRLRWAWFQRFFWRTRLVTAAAFLFVLNWAKRMR